MGFVRRRVIQIPLIRCYGLVMAIARCLLVVSIASFVSLRVGFGELRVR